MIYQRKFKSKGKLKKSKLWTVEFRWKGRLIREGGFTSRDMASQWEAEQRTRLTRNIKGLGRKNQLAALVRPLVDEYEQHLRSLKRSEMYVYTTHKRLVRVTEGCDWITLQDIDAYDFAKWRGVPQRQKGRKRSAAPKTLNQVLDALKQWGDWLVKDRGVLSENPFSNVKKLKAPDNTFYRRGMTAEEISGLLDAATKWRSFYHFLLMCPLRMRAVKGLTWQDIDLGLLPCVMLPARLNKAGKDERIPLRADVAATLRALKRDAKPSDRVFPEVPTIHDLRDDLEKAGIDYGTGDRMRIDLHSFRKTAVGMLKGAGVGIDEAHKLLGHGDRATTERYYTDDPTTARLREAIESVPSPRPMRIVKGA